MGRESPADLAARHHKTPPPRASRIPTLLFELYHDRRRQPKLFQLDKNYLAKPSCKNI
jgi:hypothetical protein